MDSVLNFLANYCFIFLIISGVLLVALIGFAVKLKKDGKGEVAPVEGESAPNAEGTTEQGEAITPPSVFDNPEPIAPPVPETPEVPSEPTLVIPDPATTPVVPEVPTVGDAPMMGTEPVAPSEPTLVIPDPATTPAVPEVPIQPTDNQMM